MDPEEKHIYTCPISYRIFTDPVRADDGKFYQREEIMEWLTKSNRSPFTRLPISNNLVTDEEFNKKLKDYVERCEKNNIECEVYSLSGYIISMPDETTQLLVNHAQLNHAQLNHAQPNHIQLNVANRQAGGFNHVVPFSCSALFYLIYIIQFVAQSMLAALGMIFYKVTIDCEYNLDNGKTTESYLLSEFLGTCVMIICLVISVWFFRDRHGMFGGALIFHSGISVWLIIMGTNVLFTEGIYSGSQRDSFPYAGSNMLCFDSENGTKIAVLLYSLKCFCFVLVSFFMWLENRMLFQR